MKETALLAAARLNHVDIVLLLFDFNSNFNTHSGSGDFANSILSHTNAVCYNFVNIRITISLLSPRNIVYITFCTHFFETRQMYRLV